MNFSLPKKDIVVSYVNDNMAYYCPVLLDDSWDAVEHRLRRTTNWLDCKKMDSFEFTYKGDPVPELEQLLRQPELSFPVLLQPKNSWAPLTCSQCPESSGVLYQNPSRPQLFCAKCLGEYEQNEKNIEMAMILNSR